MTTSLKHKHQIKGGDSPSLTVRQAAFVSAYTTPGTTAYGNATECYRQCYAVANWKEASITRAAHNVMAVPAVASVLQKGQDLAQQSVNFDKVEVMRHLVDLATADPTAVVMHRRICCRYCHGVDHAYQWRDADEYFRAVADAMQRNAMREKRRAKARNADDVEPDEDLPTDDGGYGWRRPEKPHSGCPSCDGEGHPDVFIPDFDSLSPRDRRLIASVKQTKDGVEVKMRDQDGALTTIAQILKMLVNKQELSGPDGGPIPLAGVLAAFPVSDSEAGQIYQRMMEGGK